MSSNICLVGLLNNYTKNVAKLVSSTLEMFYTDVTEVLEYDLMDMAFVEGVAGKDYIDKQETNTIKTLSSYENTLFTIDFSSLNQKMNLKYVKDGCLLIYLKTNKKCFKQNLEQEQLSATEVELATKQFKNRDLILTDIVDLVVDVSNKSNEVEIILKKIEEYYEKR